MGNTHSSSSSHRSDEQSSSNPPPSRINPAPSMAPPSYYPNPYPYSPYPPQYASTAGPWASPYPAPSPANFYGGYSGVPWIPNRYPTNPVPRLPIPSIQEPQQTLKIKNQVNVNRSTLKLSEDSEIPSHYHLSFNFDASTSGW